MNKPLITIILLSLFASGCETYRGVTVTTKRTEAAEVETNGITSASAINLFQNVTKEIGFTVEEPLKEREEISYFAHESNKYPTNKVYRLYLDIKSEQIIFTATILGTKKDFPAARNTAALFEQGLDHLGVPYSTNEYSMPVIFRIVDW